MAKPAGTITLNSGNSIGALVTHAWPYYEGSGATIHDIGASPVNATQAGAAGTNYSWGTDANGAVMHQLTAGNDAPLGSTITLTPPFTIAFRAYQDSSGNAGVVLGDTTGAGNFIWLEGGTGLIARIGGSANQISFTAWTTFAASHLYVISYDGTNVKASRDGTDSAQSGGLAGGFSFTLNALGHGHTSSTLSLIGNIADIVVFGGTALSVGQLATYAGNPDQIYTGSGGGGGGPPVGLAYLVRQSANRASTY